jgi:hypothetical protein
MLLLTNVLRNALCRLHMAITADESRSGMSFPLIVEHVDNVSALFL